MMASSTKSPSENQRDDSYGKALHFAFAMSYDDLLGKGLLVPPPPALRDVPLFGRPRGGRLHSA